MIPEVYHDTARNLVVYKTDQVDKIAQYVPNARQINGEHIAVPLNLYNAQLLALLAMPIVPVMDNYDWPIEPGRKPLAHQKISANFKVTHPRSFDLSDMGTMKTLATLWAADWLMTQFPRGTCRAMVVTPLSIMERVWGDAIFKNLD